MGTPLQTQLKINVLSGVPLAKVGNLTQFSKVWVFSTSGPWIIRKFSNSWKVDSAFNKWNPCNIHHLQSWLDFRNWENSLSLQKIEILAASGICKLESTFRNWGIDSAFKLWNSWNIQHLQGGLNFRKLGSWLNFQNSQFLQNPAFAKLTQP